MATLSSNPYVTGQATTPSWGTNSTTIWTQFITSDTTSGTLWDHYDDTPVQHIVKYREVTEERDQLKKGEPLDLTLPDMTRLIVKSDGSWEIDDSNAKKVYSSAPVLAFNPALNASDQLEKFFKFVLEIGIEKSQVMSLPIELFIKFLIVEAMTLDKEPEAEKEKEQLKIEFKKIAA